MKEPRPLINTSLQRGDQPEHETQNRFNGFYTLCVHEVPALINTPLQRGGDGGPRAANRFNGFPRGHDICGLLCLTAFLLLGLAQSGPAENFSDRPLLGFTRESAAQERALETRFDSLLKRENLREWMKRLTARPHHLGSAYDKENAEFIAAQFRSWGYETEIEEFQVFFPTPKLRLLEMIAPENFTAGLKEPPLAEDATPSQH